MPDGLTLNPDGTATLAYQTQTILLRAPNLEEYGDLIDLVDQARFDTVKLVTEANAERRKMVKEGEEAYKKAREKERAANAIHSTFISEMVKRLGDPNDIDLAKWPRWAASAELMDKMLNHWETVPFPGSAPPM